MILGIIRWCEIVFSEVGSAMRLQRSAGMRNPSCNLCLVESLFGCFHLFLFPRFHLCYQSHLL